MNKEELRKKYIKIRKEIEDKDTKSDEIYKFVIETSDYKNAHVIALYKNLPSEVNTNKLIELSLSLGKVVVLPRVVGNDMLFYKTDSLTTYEKSSFGIEEPTNDTSLLINNEDIDLVIVPGICFDLYGNRVGFGKGYYDRFLSDIDVDTIGICFDEQVIKKGNIETNSTDMKIKQFITEKGIIIRW